MIGALIFSINLLIGSIIMICLDCLKPHLKYTNDKGFLVVLIIPVVSIALLATSLKTVFFAILDGKKDVSFSAVWNKKIDKFLYALGFGEE